MKKVIFGSALMICGMIGIITEYLREAIFFASPNNISYGGNYLFKPGGLPSWVKKICNSVLILLR